MDQMICYNCFKDLGGSTNFCRHCGFPVRQDWEKYPHALPYGTALGGRYITGRVLGQGGFGITYIAQDYRSKELVAIKEFFPDTMAARGTGNSIVPYTGQRGEDFNYGKTTFLEEARTLAQFNDAPGIVHVYSYFEEFGTAYFAMEYVDGMSLQKYIEKSGGRLAWDEAKRILVPVMDALSKVHAKGIIHRDIKPDNIYINRAGEVKVLDFGSARYSMGEKSRSLDVVLTHGFAPREQYSRHGRQGAYTDVYALAATFFYSVTGKKPPDSIDRLDEDTLPLPSSLGAQIPNGEEDVLLKALSVEPQDRYQSMPEFKNALLNPSAAAQSAPYTAPQPQQAPAQAYAAPQPAAAPAYTAPQPTAAPGYAPRQPQYTPPAQPQPQSRAPYSAPVQQQPMQYAQQPQQAQYAPNYAQPAQPKKKNKWILPTVLGAVAVIAVVILAVTGVFGGKKPAEDPTATTPPTAAPTADTTESTDLTTEGKEDTGLDSSGDTQTTDRPKKPVIDIRPSTGTSGPFGTSAVVTGYYAVRSMSLNGVTLDIDAMREADLDVENTYLQLNPDHSGVMAFDGDITEDVSWTEDGTITVDSDTGFFSIENGLLTLEVEIDDGLLNMVFTRQGDSAPLAPPEDPSENADGKCGTNVYWRFEEDTLYLSGTGSTYDYSSTDDIPWYSLGAEIDYVMVGEGITRLGDGALYKCQMISVSLPTTLQSIGYLTFGFCPYLGYVEIPDSVSYLGDGSFYGSALDYVYINSRSLSMDIDVFAKCEDLAAVYFYGSIVAIGEGAFGECISTVYYPGSDSTWSGIAGKNYGGTLTWQSLDGGGSSTAMERDWYAADAFSIGLPSAWDGTYYVMTDDTNDYLTVYHKASYDEGYGGMLYSFHLFTSFSEYENIPSWQYVGGVYNTSTGEEYTLIAIFPSDVQFPSKYQDQYTHMLDSLDKLAFDGENGFTYTAQ